MGGHQLPESVAPDTLEYVPLSDTRSIRILFLLPGRGDDPLVSLLTIEPLASQPKYEAISYVWGTGSRCTELHCNDQLLHITESIGDALRRVRWANEPRRLWVDQICINQKEIAERSQQVRLMDAIYRGAQHILVWLGRDRDGVANDAAKMVRHLHGVFGDEKAHEAFRRAHSEELAQQSEEPFIPLAKLTKLPWFTRIWIVQEIGTKSPATLFWGDAELDWEMLSEVVGVLNVSYHLLRTRFAIYTPNIRYLYRRFVEPEVDYDEDHNRGNFIYELHRARHMRAKDARDHIYAFLGHYSLHRSSSTIAGIEPDYGRSVNSVYTDVAIRGLTGAKSLIVLSACHCTIPENRNFSGGHKRPTLPSWVPDFRLKPMHLMGAPDSPHRAAGTSLPKLTIHDLSLTLNIEGFRIDTTSDSGFTFYNKSLHMRASHDHKLVIDTVWHDVCGMGTYNLEDLYVNGKDSAFFALTQTLSNGCIGGDRSRRYENIPKEEWLANGAAYVVRNRSEATTEGGDDIAPDVIEASKTGDPFKWSHEATLVSRYRRFVVTSKGYYLIGPDGLKEGDVVVILYGGRTPFVLRPKFGGRWVLLGECYVHGLMNGEAFKNKTTDETFALV